MSHKLTVKDCEEKISRLNEETSYPNKRLFIEIYTQLADTMRENEFLKSQLETATEEEFRLTKALSNKHPETKCPEDFY